MAVTTASPAVVGCHRGCVLPPAVVHVASHSITSILQSLHTSVIRVVANCLETINANSQMTSNAIHSVSFRLAGLSAGK